MDEHAPCSQCRHRNPTENRFCGRCGASLSESRQLVPRPKGSFPISAGRALPGRLKPVGKALAVGAAILVAEACLSRLGRRSDGGSPVPLSVARGSEPAAPGRLVGEGLEEMLVLLDQEQFGGRVFERRAVRWFYATESAGRRG